MTHDPMQRARILLAGAPSWHELRRQLDAEGLGHRLGSAALDLLLLEWHRREAASLSPDGLAGELAFWAGGGGFASHLKGYNAVPPAVLIDEARRRGWFVRPLGSGGAVVNAPDGRPLVVRGLV